MVRDTSGAVIQGASVTLTNTATGVKTTTKTNNEGLYVFPYVQPGVYDVSASGSGFQTVKKPGVTVNVTERVQVSFDLKVGNITQTVRSRARRHCSIPSMMWGGKSSAGRSSTICRF